MMFVLYSPWGWAIIGVLLATFIFANIMVDATTNIEQATILVIDPDGPYPDLTREAFHSLAQDIPLYETRAFWAYTRAVAVITLIVIVCVPFFFTYSGYAS
jgi:hypothetical protein